LKKQRRKCGQEKEIERNETRQMQMPLGYFIVLFSPKKNLYMFYVHTMRENFTIRTTLDLLAVIS
jgi:hypothetical protein